MSAISFKIKVGCFCPTIFLKLFYKTPRLFKAPLFNNDETDKFENKGGDCIQEPLLLIEF